MNLMRIIFTFFLLSCAATAQAQKMDTVYVEKEGVFQKYYLALLPEQASKGLLVILPGFGTMPEGVLKETQLPQTACQAGYTVVIPLLLRYDMEDTAFVFQSRLEVLIPELMQKYKTPEGKFILGGHSLGGNQALFYAEKAYMLSDTTLIKPDLVFGVDPPLDLKRLYNAYARSLELYPEKAKGSEAEFITKRFRRIYGGTPEERPDAYEAASSYYRDARDGGNARYLKNVPLRLYSDPDVLWYILERNMPMEWTNTADLSACIVLLRRLGNQNAGYVPCLGKGWLPNGKRHPHAFSMLDAGEFVGWVNKVLYNE
ncbi:MAG: alpha/beta fold hydrolase [Lewinellaceae bacterium]|nr:alpha/beta fold hydrolase [Lewinellaceae bacterium]